MLRKLFLALILFLSLVGCATPSSPAAIAPAATTVIGPVAPERTPAVVLFGAVTVLPVQGKASIALRSQPDPNAPALAEVKPGDSGKLLGIDASGKWMLVEIKKQTGWAPVQYLDYTIAQ
jgi:hypothetical protein